MIPHRWVREETVLSAGFPVRLFAELWEDPDPVFRRGACRAWDVLGEEARRSLLGDSDPDVWSAAALRACREDEQLTDRLAQTLTDRWQLDDLVRHGRLSRALAERFVSESAASRIEPTAYAHSARSTRPRFTNHHRMHTGRLQPDAR